MDQQAYKNLISGQSQGCVSSLLRALLQIASLGYGAAVHTRNWLYCRHALKSHPVDVPVICIGNLTAGGTGKTPLVIWLYHYLRRITSVPCAIVTRGYKAADETVADEPSLFARHCPEARMVINPDRVAGARQAIQDYAAGIIIMDDGFQHRRLARDLDIITVDATAPFGYGRLLPAGLLREPVAALGRAQAVVLTRCDQVPEGDLQTMERTLKNVNPHLVVARTRHAPSAVRLLDQSSLTCDCLAGKRVFAFCGIGNPQAFFQTLSQLDAELVGTQIYNDHHHCTQADLEALSVQAEQSRADYLLTTEKNFADIEGLEVPAGLPLGCLTVALAFTRGREELCTLIECTLAGKIPGLVERE